MPLSDTDLKRALYLEQLIVTPLLEPIQPASIDLRLGDEILWTNVTNYPQTYDPERNVYPQTSRRSLEISGQLYPGDFVNVATLEEIGIGNGLTGSLVGKSRHARHGLQVESAGFLDPGYRGHPTLELKNLGPYIIVLRPGMPIAQLRVDQLTVPVTRLYGNPELGSHFQGATGPEMYRAQT
jgi:dCTP deaminase